MKYRIYLAPTLFLVLFMSFCRNPKELEYREFNNLIIEKLGFTTSALNVNIVYFNPNNFSMELSRTELDIYIDSSYLGHSSQELQVAIPKKNTFTVPVKIDVDMKNFFKNGLIALLNKEVTIRAIGNIKVGKAGVYKNFKVDYSTKQKLSNL